MSEAAANWHVSQASYESWLREVEAPMRKRMQSVDGPLISIVLTTYNTPQHWLCQAIDSVRNQRYQNWELCIVDDGSTETAVWGTLVDYRQRDTRIKVKRATTNSGIATAGNSAIAMATGDYVAFMDHDDCLPDHALLCVAHELAQHADARLLYTDADHLDINGQRCRPYFKPAWNHELLLGQNYLNHLTVIAMPLLQELGGLREGYDGSQDYDLLLRAVELLQADQIRHIPAVLYHWREVPDSVSRSDLASAAAAARRAVQEHLQRIGSPASVHPARGALIYNRVDWPLPQPRPSIAVLRQYEPATAPEQVRHKTATHDGITVIECPRPATLPQLLAQLDACDLQRCDMLCSVPPGSQPRGSEWLMSLAAIAGRREVGCVGTALDHGGEPGPPPVVSGELGCETYWGEGRAYFAAARLDREVLLLEQQAPLLLRQEHLRALAAAADASLESYPVHMALALGCQRMGLRNIWTPGILATVPAGAPPDDFAVSAPEVQSDDDPNYNPNLAFCRQRPETA